MKLQIYTCEECGPAKGISFIFPGPRSPDYDYRKAGEALTSHAEQKHDGKVNFRLIERKK